MGVGDGNRRTQVGDQGRRVLRETTRIGGGTISEMSYKPMIMDTPRNLGGWTLTKILSNGEYGV